MAERVLLVCDVCGDVARTSVGIKVDGRSLTKDLCEVHLDELVSGARRPRPGRRRKTAGPAASTRTQAKKASSRRTPGKRGGRKPPASSRKRHSAKSKAQGA